MKEVKILKRVYTKEEYTEYRKLKPVNFIYEGDIRGFSCVVVEKDGIYFENWLRPEANKWNKWVLLEKHKITKNERNKLWLDSHVSYCYSEV
jgi:hypothetical protein